MLQFSQPALFSSTMAAQVVSGAKTPDLIGWCNSKSVAIGRDHPTAALLIAEAGAQLARATNWWARGEIQEIRTQLAGLIEGFGNTWSEIARENGGGGTTDISALRSATLSGLRAAAISRLREMPAKSSLGVQLFLGVPIVDGGLSTFCIGERQFSLLFHMDKTQGRGFARGAVSALAEGLRGDFPKWAAVFSPSGTVLLLQAILHRDAESEEERTLAALIESFFHEKKNATNRLLLAHTLLVCGIPETTARELVLEYDDQNCRELIRTLLPRLGLLS